MAEEGQIDWVTQTTKRTNLDDLDKILLGNSATGETQHTTVVDVAKKVAEVPGTGSVFLVSSLAEM